MWDFREARARSGGFIYFSCITYLSEEDHGNLSRIHRFTITVGLQAISGDRTLSRFETELEAYDWNLLVDTVRGSPMLVKIEVWAGSFELLVTLVKRVGGALHVAESSLLLRYDNTGDYSSSEEAWREITLKEVEDVIETQVRPVRGKLVLRSYLLSLFRYWNRMREPQISLIMALFE